MQLTRHTDYALRLLIDLAGRGDARVQIDEVAERQGISRSHLKKIANGLARAGIIEAVRGRGGGIRLAHDPADIGLKQVLDVTEPRCAMVDCGSCRLVRGCNLPGILGRAKNAFDRELAGFSLADVVGRTFVQSAA